MTEDNRNSPSPVTNAVGSEPVGYVTKNELTKLRLGASCVDLFGKVVPTGFEMVPLFENAASIDRPRAAFNLAKAILEHTDGEWEPSIAQSFAILEATLAAASTEDDT